MIPISLKLENFMAYREENVDFTGFHLAALTGANGSGKSSLLDAVTWALWGKSRANNLDDLIHLGQSDMSVEYSFMLYGDKHRVLRKRSKKGRGRSALSLQMWRAEANDWLTVSEGISETQKKIDGLMRLDYDTFVNSAFLLQGQADAFTTKGPAERKAILGDILGLEIYQTYEERAKQRLRTAQKELTVSESKIKQIDEQLAQQATYEEKLRTAEQAVAEASAQLQGAEATWQSLYEQHQQISEKQGQLEGQQQRLKSDMADIAYLERSVAETAKQQAAYEAILARQTEIEQGLAALQQAQDEVAQWDEKWQKFDQLSQRQHATQRELDSAQAQLQADLQGAAATIKLLTERVQATESYRQQLSAVQEEMMALEAVEARRQEQQQRMGQLEQEAARLEEQQWQIEAEGKKLRGQMQQLQEAEAVCPVCKSALDAAHRAQATTQFEQEIEGKRGIYRQNKLRLQQIATEQQTLRQAVDEATERLRRLAKVRGRVGQLQQQLAEAEAAASQLAATEAEHAAVQQQLAENQFAPELRTQLQTVQTALETVAYDRAAHETVRKTVNAQRHFETEGDRLADAMARLPGVQERLVQEEQRLARLQTQTAQDREQIAELKKETAALPQLSQKLQTARNKVDQLRQVERQDRDKVAAAKQQLDYLDQLREQRREHQQAKKEHQQAVGIYQELRAAFGKRGIQALLIESAVPEVEQAANELLSRMTDGRMHLRFETQREAKTTDNIIETLEIRISDELGTRDYAMFSGGEAFRINFAIRIAISQLLARRAGAQLQTLIIDEGFGSQDGAGRERLLEAINTIQYDFEKVIVITHVEELQEAFPVRLAVEKTAMGSRVALR